MPGVQIVGTCSGDPTIGIAQNGQPGVTNAHGQTTATITADLDDIGGGRSGSCVFTTTTGSPSVTVTLKGTDKCLTSPAPAGCTGTTTPTTHNLVVNLVPGPGGGYGNVVSAPPGIDCPMATASVPVSCPFAFNAGQSVVLSATLLGPATGITWSGGCTAISAGSLTATVSLAADTVCTGTFKP